MSFFNFLLFLPHLVNHRPYEFSTFCEANAFDNIFFALSSLVEFGANVGNIHKKTCLVPLDAKFFKL